MQGQTTQSLIRLSPIRLGRALFIAAGVGTIAAGVLLAGGRGSAAGPAAVAAYAAIIAGTVAGLAMVRERPGLQWVLGVIGGSLVRMLVSLLLGALIVWTTGVDAIAFWISFLGGSAAVLVAETLMVTSRLKAANH